MTSPGDARSRPRDWLRARRAALGRLVAALLAVAALACGDRVTLPDAELLVISGDSTFWVTSKAGAVRIRGVPMLVARVDGTFRELYVADDDQSYFDALFVGFRLFSRDLERGDSIELRRDTSVHLLAGEYARRHPGDGVLPPDEPENDNPSIHAEGDVEILALHGPYLSYEHHTDIDSRGDNAWAGHRHSVRRGVLDIRSGKAVTLAELFAKAASDSAIATARAEWQRTGKSMRFDALSFTLGSEGMAPTVRFAVPDSSTKGDASVVELTSHGMSAPAWWRDAANELPRESGDKEIWSTLGDTLTVSANRESHVWALQLTHNAAGPRAVARLSSAVERVIWLDGSVTAAARTALTRAFAEASEYDGSGQVAADSRHASPGSANPRRSLTSARDRIHFQDYGHFATTPFSPRVAARVVGADDASGREYPRTRVRRCDSRDARQDGGRLRYATCADALRHRIG